MTSSPKSPSLPDNPLVLRRDSFIYRARALGFHIDLLKAQFDGFSKQAENLKGDQADHYNLVYDCQHFLTFCLDDILVNAISLLDYTGNLAGLIIRGPNFQKLKWDGLAHSANDPNNPIASSHTGPVVVALNSEWADRLGEVRSRVIHYGASLGKGSQTLTLFPDRFVSTLSFTVPAPIVSRLPFLKAIRQNDEVDMIVGAEAICLKTLDAAQAVVDALAQDLAAKKAGTSPK